jgi:hypothetical protein
MRMVLVSGHRIDEQARSDGRYLQTPWVDPRRLPFIQDLTSSGPPFSRYPSFGRRNRDQVWYTHPRPERSSEKVSRTGDCLSRM